MKKFQSELNKRLFSDFLTLCVHHFFYFRRFCICLPKHHASQASSHAGSTQWSRPKYFTWRGRPCFRWSNRCTIFRRSIISSFVVLLHRLGRCVNLPAILTLRLHAFQAHEISSLPQGFLKSDIYLKKHLNSQGKRLSLTSQQE